MQLSRRWQCRHLGIGNQALCTLSVSQYDNRQFTVPMGKLDAGVAGVAGVAGPERGKDDERLERKG